MFLFGLQGGFISSGPVQILVYSRVSSFDYFCSSQEYFFGKFNRNSEIVLVALLMVNLTKLKMKQMASDLFITSREEEFLLFTTFFSDKRVLIGFDLILCILTVV